MRKYLFVSLLLTFVHAVKAQDTSWNGYRISYVGKKSISKKWMVIKMLNC